MEGGGGGVLKVSRARGRCVWYSEEFRGSGMRLDLSFFVRLVRVFLVFGRLFFSLILIVFW